MSEARNTGIAPSRAALGPRIPALRNGVAVLNYLASKSSPVPANSISRKLAIPRSSTYQLLQVLIDEGLVVHIPEAQGYKLGVGLFELGTAYLRHQPLEHLARPLLAKLVGRLNLTLHLGILYGHDSLYLIKEQPPRSPKLITEVGLRLPAHLTATGRAMLSLLPPSQIAATFSTRERFIDRTGRGAHTLRELRSVLALDKSRGWAIEDGAVTDAVTCIAAAATDHNQMPVASLSASFYTSAVGSEHWDSIARELKDAADQLTKRLGGAPVAPSGDDSRRTA